MSKELRILERQGRLITLEKVDKNKVKAAGQKGDDMCGIALEYCREVSGVVQPEIFCNLYHYAVVLDGGDMTAGEKRIYFFYRSATAQTKQKHMRFLLGQGILYPQQGILPNFVYNMACLTVSIYPNAPVAEPSLHQDLSILWRRIGMIFV